VQVLPTGSKLTVTRPKPMDARPPHVLCILLCAAIVPSFGAPALDAIGSAGPPQGAERPYHGLAVQIHSAGNAVDRYGRLIAEIAVLGADTVLLSVNGYQERIDSVLIETDHARTPSIGQLSELIDTAHAKGLRVMLMPKILLRDPRSGDWRGKIKPPTWQGWFSQYRKFILPYAHLAEQLRVEVFIIGSELVSTERLTDYWVELIAEVRTVYHGKLSYSANWDHYTAIQFWDRLDLIGMTSYFKLAEEAGPPRETLVDSWREIRSDIRAFQAKVNKPVLFTEAGWHSQEGCSVEAWNYYRHEKATPAALEEQRLNYEVFIELWSHDPAVAGIIWWEWTESGGPNDPGYTPKNKPAESELRKLFHRGADPQ
jgi:hypothetical protein